jgi:transposase-like protein
VLDILVQKKRHKAAALKLMRKLLKKQGFAQAFGGSAGAGSAEAARSCGFAVAEGA